jgi:hypothetical protein
MMNWIKKGHIYAPDGSISWSQSHAQVPICDYSETDNTIKIYFSTRDEKGRSNPNFIVVDANNPQKVLFENTTPILALGRAGTFDDSGVMPSWILDYDNKKYLYYIGWNVRNTIPYHNSVGLAISEDNGETFQKISEGPLWDRNYIEPYFSGTTCVMIDDNGVWRNWYLSCTEWKEVKGIMEPRYHLKYAESTDGIAWTRKGTIAIDYKNDEEAGLVKASVIKENGIYKMWFSYRNFTDYRVDAKQSYRIGYAESNDGIKWNRKDNLMTMDISENSEDFDSLMLAYPHVLPINNQLHLFYNGNGFGKTGFGYAVLDN